MRSHKHWYSESYQHSYLSLCYPSFISYHVLTGGCVFVGQTNLPKIPLDILPESPVVAGDGRRKSQKNLDNKNEKKIGQKIKMTFGLGVCCV